jgi:DNA-binding response OmpR family regulator
MSPARAMPPASVESVPASGIPGRFLDGIRLTRKERALLEMLMQNPGRCISRKTLLKSVWNYAEDARTRTVDVHVQRLRRKLGPRAESLKTIVRIGYCWLPETAGA